MKLYSGSANGVLKATFTGPAMLDASSVKNYAFTPSSAVILPRSTTYWVVVEGATDWTYTLSTGEDGTSAVGWSIGDNSEYRNEDSTGNFLPDTGNPFLIHVTGTLGGIVLSSDATLSALVLEDASDNSAITISPVFASGTTSYTASVGNGVDEITIAPTVNESNATVEYLDSSDAAITDADSGKTGQQVSLSVDANTIKVKVTAEDTTTDTYTVVVTRAAAAPMVTDVDVTSSPDSGDTYGTSEMILFTVTFDQAVMVTGTPEFEFCLGTASCDVGTSPPARRRAALSSGSGTTALVFGYTVVVGDVDDNGIWIGNQDRTIKLETGDTIQGTVSGLDAVLTHDELGEKTGHKVNGASSNTAPTVATEILDQTATTGAAFSFAFPAATFTDADGDTLTYTATLADDSALPAWLSFTAATRAFSGTPQAADVETVSVKVMASDGNGGSGSDTFDIVVSAATGICSRTAEVQTALLDATGRATCSDVTAADLVAVTSLTVNNYSGTVLDPADFAGLTGLTNLLFGGSPQLTTLPDNAFAGVTALTHLDFNSLVTVTMVAEDAFSGLTALENLNLSANDLTTLDEDTFDGLTALRILDLSFTSLESLDADIFDGLTALEEIDLSFSSMLAALDADIFDGLIALHTLDLGYTGLTTLDADIFDGLTALRLLSLSGNSLTTLDADIFDGLTALSRLELQGNRLTALDADIFDGLTALEQVYLSANLLTTLDADIFDGLTPPARDLARSEQPGHAGRGHLRRPHRPGRASTP